MDTNVSRRGFLKGLMAASALVAVSPTLLAPVEALAQPVAGLPDVDVGDLWMRVEDDPWFFLGKTLAAEVWIEPEFELDLPLNAPYPGFRGLARRDARGRFEIAGDAQTDRFLERMMEWRGQAEFMVGCNFDAVRARCYVTTLAHEYGPVGLGVNRIDVMVTGPLEFIT